MFFDSTFLCIPGWLCIHSLPVLTSRITGMCHKASVKLWILFITALVGLAWHCSQSWKGGLVALLLTCHFPHSLRPRLGATMHRLPRLSVLSPHVVSIDVAVDGIFSTLANSAIPHSVQGFLWQHPSGRGGMLTLCYWCPSQGSQCLWWWRVFLMGGGDKVLSVHGSSWGY